MQIDPTRLSQLSSVGVQKVAPGQVQASETAATQANGAVNYTDRIMLSQQAAEVQAAHETLAQTPEVRAELVAKFKAQIEAGTYQVNADKIAERLLGG